MAKAKAGEPEKDRSERWLLTYADMITLLLGLFVILYATSKVDTVKFEQVVTSLQKAFNPDVLRGAQAQSVISTGNVANTFVGLTSFGATIGPELVTYAQKQELGDQISVTASKDAVVITLSGAWTFGSGSAELQPEGKEALQFIANALRALPDSNTIHVEGHTDNLPSASGRFPSNWDLSAARAGTAARILTENGVDGSRVSATGFADTRPIADNITPEGRGRNRRVEIWIGNLEPLGPASIAPPVVR
jgi:chemotaxis protein MotB